MLSLPGYIDFQFPEASCFSSTVSLTQLRLNLTIPFPLAPDDETALIKLDEDHQAFKTYVHSVATSSFVHSFNLFHPPPSVAGQKLNTI